MTRTAGARFAVSLIGALLHFVSALHAQSPARPAATADRIFAESPAVFFEHYSTWADASPDGRWALYTGWTGVRMLDIRAKRLAPERIWAGLSETYGAVWGPAGTVVLYGVHDSTVGWYAQGSDGPRLLPLPRGAAPTWSSDGRLVAWSRRSIGDTVWIANGGMETARAVPVAGRGITGKAWLPNGSALLVLAVQPRGSSSLVRIDATSGETRVIASGLDAPPVSLSPVAIAPDGRRAFVGLASSGDPEPKSRHAPRASRGVGIYAVDLATGARELIVPPPDGGGDAMAPSVGGGSLFWTTTRTESSVVVIPAGGGRAEVVMHGAFVPSWRPDSRRIGFAYGDWRWADWAIDWDGGAVDVDARGHPVGPLTPVITGDHEDFQPVWSPRGRWIAFHSHRPTSPDPFYDAAGASDDIWIKPDDAPARDSAEIRVTDFGEEAGPPDWSPDGRQMVFTSQERDGLPGVDQAFVVTIDTLTGHATDHRRLSLPPEIRNVKSVAWSPDGRQIAIEEDVGAGRHALWTVASDGTRARKLTEFAMSTYAGLSWARGRRAIIYPAIVQGRMQLFRIDVDGGQPKQLSEEDANLLQPAVSPDGRLIAATRMVHSKEVWRLELSGR